MTSKERKEARYQRRKAKRYQKLVELNKRYGHIEDAFTFDKVWYYANKCCNGVRFKLSTKNFELSKFSIVGSTCNDILNNTYKVGKTYDFQINERGKTREIDAPQIKDRLVHKVLANEVINPIYSNYLIYDNGASTVGKGFKFTLDRVKLKLRKFYKKYKGKGYIVIIDFSKYFENIDHDILREIHKKYIFDEYTRKVIEDYLFVSKGLPLGVEIAQREACMYPNILDKYVENRGCPVIRYMDDSLFLTRTLDEANDILNNYYIICDKLNIKINKNKTKIIRIGNEFVFCKWKFIINKNNKIIMIPVLKTVNRQKNKLKKMFVKNIDIGEIKITLDAYIAYLNHGNSNRYIKELKKIYFNCRFKNKYII